MKYVPSKEIVKALRKQLKASKSEEIIAAARGYNKLTNSWVVYLGFSDIDGQSKVIALPREDLLGQATVKKRLIRAGAPSSTVSSMDIESLIDERPRTFHMFDTAGWHGDSFLSGNRVYARDGAPDCRLIDEPDWTVKGDFKDWQKGIKSALKCSDRLIVAMSTAFLAPVMPYLDIDNFGVHFYGPSSTGKSTLLNSVAALVGRPREYSANWRITDNAFKIIAQQRNHHVLVQDGNSAGIQNGTSLRDLLKSITSLLDSGQEKKRRKPDPALAITPSLSWQLTMLSAGEISLREVAEMSMDGRLTGEEMRLIDIPAADSDGFGVFDRLPKGWKSGAALSDHLSALADKHHGMAYDRFLKRLVKRSSEEIAESLHAHQNTFHEYSKTLNVDRHHRRLADRFAAIFAAGCLAVDLKILPIDRKTVRKAALKCLKLALEAAKSLKTTAADEGMSALTTAPKKAVKDRETTGKIRALKMKLPKYGKVIAIPILHVNELVPIMAVRNDLQNQLWKSGQLFKPKNHKKRKTHQVKIAAKTTDVWLFRDGYEETASIKNWRNRSC
jgi:limonene-1,2-epoxide hydrolase